MSSVPSSISVMQFCCMYRQRSPVRDANPSSESMALPSRNSAFSPCGGGDAPARVCRQIAHSAHTARGRPPKFELAAVRGSVARYLGPLDAGRPSETLTGSSVRRRRPHSL